MEFLGYDRETVINRLRAIAKERMSLHKNHSTSRPLSQDYEFIGLLGEFEFMLFSGFPMDLSVKPSGDKGIDFITPAGSIDVKTARLAYNLIREENKKHADIIVLGSYTEGNQSVNLLGWEYDSIMILCPKRDFGYGIINHYKPAKKLRSMKELREKIGNNTADIPELIRHTLNLDDIVIKANSICANWGTAGMPFFWMEQYEQWLKDNVGTPEQKARYRLALDWYKKNRAALP
jgi:hypothetical protein